MKKNRSLLKGAGLLLCLLSFSWGPAAGEENGTGGGRLLVSEEKPQWGPQKSNHFFTAGYARETDPGGPSLEGWRVATGLWDETGGYKVALYMMGETGDDQDVFGIGADLMLFPPWKNPLRIGFPLVRLGIEHRSSDPQDGISGIFGIGTEIGLWIGKSWQVSATVVREFGFPSGTRDEVGINVRWLHSGDSIWDFPR